MDRESAINIAGITQTISDDPDLERLEQDIIAQRTFKPANIAKEIRNLQQKIEAPVRTLTPPPEDPPDFDEPSWGIKDPDLRRTTEEQRKTSFVNDVVGDPETDSVDEKFLAEELMDEVARELEEVDALRTALEDEHGQNLSRIPLVNEDTPPAKRQMVLKILQKKYERVRYTTIFDDAVMALAHGVETLFDGEREWFGRKPNLVGWSDTVRIKLRHLKKETSAFVGGIMEEYNFSHGTRIAMELIPSMFLHSRSREVRPSDGASSPATRYNDDEWKDAQDALESVSS